MGLDMYLYKIYKPKESEEQLSKMSYDDLQDKQFLLLIEGETMPDNVDSIRQFAKKIKTRPSYINFRKIKKDYQIPAHSRITGQSYCSSQVGYSFRLPDGTSKKIQIPVDELKKKYITVRTVNAECIGMENVAYWRKHYDLQDDLHKASDIPIDNCGYYPLNDDMWKVLEHHDKEKYDELYHYRNDDTCEIVYLEWY